MTSRWKKVVPALLAWGVLAAPALAQPQFKDAAAAIEFRQSALKLMGAYSQALADVVRGNTPYDAAQVKQDVAVFQTLATLPWQAFGPGTEGGNARPDVWQDTAKFAEAAKTLQTNMRALVAAANTNDPGQLRAAFGNTANSCRACHDSFRQRR